MKIETSVTIRSDFVRRGKRRAENGELKVPLVADVPEIDAPVVLWSTSNDAGTTRKAWRRDGNSYLVPLKGKMPAPSCRWGHPKLKDQPDGSLSGEEFQAYLADGAPDSLLSHGSKFDRNARLIENKTVRKTDIRNPVPTDARSVEETGDTVARTMADCIRRNYAIVDGVIHERRRLLPFWSLNDYSGVTEPRVREDLFPDPSGLISILDLTTRHIKDSPCAYKIKRPTLVIPEVVDESLLLEDGAGQTVVLVSGWVLANGLSRSSGFNSLGQNAMSISATSLEGLVTYAELRDAWVTEAPAQILARKLAAFRGSDLPGLAGTSYRIPIDDLDTAVGGLETRP